MTSRRFLLPMACALLLGGVAGADDRKEAVVEMEKANAHLARHEYEAAIARFNVARKLAPQSSGPVLGLGLAYAATDRCKEAVAYLEEYMQRQKSPKTEAVTALSTCKNKMVRLKITSEPSGAEVRFDAEDGPVAGTTPLETTQLSPGTHRVYVTLPKYKTHVAEVVVEAGILSWVSVKLDELPALPTLPSSPIEPAPAEPLTAPTPIEPPKTPTEPPRTTHDPASPIQSSEPTAAAAPPQERPRPAEAPRPAGEAVSVRMVDAELDVTASDPASVVYVNNQAVSGDGRARLRLPPGIYGVAVQKDGFRGSEGAITLAAGDRKAFKADLKPLKSHGFLNLGVTFTVLGLIVEGAAIAGHFLAEREFNSTPAYDNFDHFHNLEVFGQVAAGVCGGLALIGYIVEAVTNRGKVEEGRAYPLSPVMWPTPVKGSN